MKFEKTCKFHTLKPQNNQHVLLIHMKILFSLSLNNFSIRRILLKPFNHFKIRFTSVLASKTLNIACVGINFHANSQQRKRSKRERRRQLTELFNNFECLFLLSFSSVFITRKFLGFPNLLFLVMYVFASHIDSRVHKKKHIKHPEWWWKKTIGCEKKWEIFIMLYFLLWIVASSRSISLPTLLLA